MTREQMIAHLVLSGVDASVYACITGEHVLVLLMSDRTATASVPGPCIPLTIAPQTSYEESDVWAYVPFGMGTRVGARMGRAMTPEGKVKEQVKKVLRRCGTYWHMPVQNGMGEPTLDFVCCHKGIYVAIETKAPGKHPTPRQRITMNDIEKAGGFVFTVSNDQELAYLENFLLLLGGS